MTQKKIKEFLRELLIDQAKLIVEQSKKPPSERNESLKDLTESMSTVVCWLIGDFDDSRPQR